MPNQLDHINKARHNEAFAASIKETQFLDWLVNGVFYSAMHYTEAYLAINNNHPNSHPVRNEFIQEDPNLGWNFYRNMYRPLRDDSYEARYNMRIFTLDEINRHIIPLLESVKQHLSQYIRQINI